MYPRAPISTSALRIASSCTARLPHPQGTFVRTRANHYFSHVSRACKVGIGPLLLAFMPTQSSLCARPEKNRMVLSRHFCYRRHLPPFRFTGHGPLFSRHSLLTTSVSS